MAPWTAATTATSHPLTHTRLDIRLNPSRGDPNRPFAPGEAVSGEVSLVVDNEEGVKDVKHKLSVASVGVRVFWEARSLTEPISSQEYYRGGSVFVPLTSGQEDVLLMPGGGESLESSWSFEITLPEKSSIEESHNLSSKGKSASPLHLSSGPPPSFVGQRFSVEHVVEASVVFADGVPSTEMDERGHRIAGELELVERKVIPFRPDGEKVLVSNEFQSSDWKKEVEVTGAEGRSLGSLSVSIHPPPLPIPASLPSIPLDIKLHLSPPSKVEKKEKKGLFGLGKGKEKKKEEEAQAAASFASGQDSFVVESVTAKIVVATTGEPDITLSELCTLNISSNHPTLSSPQGLSTEVHLDLASSAPSNLDPTLGSFILPNASRQVRFFPVLLSLSPSTLLTSSSFPSSSSSSSPSLSNSPPQPTLSSTPSSPTSLFPSSVLPTSPMSRPQEEEDLPDSTTLLLQLGILLRSGIKANLPRLENLQRLRAEKGRLLEDLRSGCLLATTRDSFYG
ncbi:hypothetical protein BDY24DRAFT_403543 [Mrakia frigida]|uniref:uncharacterized protein n=1 Tax=Mrakia frigida TaxID=29902 RepID=UPI003FCC0AAB